MAEQKIQLVSGSISPAGDQWTEVYRHSRNPMTWPEVLVLRQLHGDDSVRNLKHVGWIGRPAKQERDRLTRIYGAVVGQVFPGSSPRMEMDGGDEVEGDTSKGDPDNPEDEAEQEGRNMPTEHEKRDAKKRADKARKVREDGVKAAIGEDPAANDWRQPEPGTERVERKRDVENPGEFENQNFDLEPTQTRPIAADEASNEEASNEAGDEEASKAAPSNEEASNEGDEAKAAPSKEPANEAPKVEAGVEMPRKGRRNRGSGKS